MGLIMNARTEMIFVTLETILVSPKMSPVERLSQQPIVLFFLSSRNQPHTPSMPSQCEDKEETHFKHNLPELHIKLTRDRPTGAVA